jgi:hypothetical protein
MNISVATDFIQSVVALCLGMNTARCRNSEDHTLKQKVGSFIPRHYSKCM